MNITRLIDAIWIGLLIFWFAASAGGKRAARVETGGSRLLHIVPMVIAFGLLFEPRVSVGILATRFVPDSPAAALVGLAITLCGVAFAIWARLYIGRNWSASVQVKQGHELIRSGPYAVVRHPIYSGLLLAMLGTAIAFGEVRGLAGVLVALAGWRIKSLAEERFMAEQFPIEYPRYRTRVKALIPFIL